MTQTPVVVVGGGAAGMMAALAARRAGAAVVLLEPNEKLGRKLYITGKGRCNLTNNTTPEGVLAHVTRNGRFLYSAVTRFPPAAVMEYFEALGVPLKTERGGRVFPCSDRAADVIDALFFALKKEGVVLRRGKAEELRLAQGRVVGVSLGEESLPAGAVILATGGLSYPATGSTGDGYDLARRAGHTIVQPAPSLVPLESSDPCCGQMQGLALKNVVLTVKNRKGKIVYRELGELLFTHFGLSGPLVLSASAHMRSFDKDQYTCVIDLKPALEESALDARLVRELTANANRDMANVMGTLLPRLMIPVVLQRAEVPSDRKAHDLTKGERRRLLETLKGFRIPVSGPRPIAEAIITAGGVKVGEVDPKTMASKKTDGLYFAGELLDVDAYTGGFNLQIAWATGRAAGESAAERLQNGL